MRFRSWRRGMIARLAAVLSLVFAGTMPDGLASSYPERPVKLVVPYPPGGASDILARALADSLAKDLKQPIIVENKPGANTVIGAEMVARSAPDGYTLFLASGSNMVLNPLMYKRLPYDPGKDFRVLSIITELPLIMVTHPAIPAKTVAEFVTHARQHGDKLNYASVGVGGPLHLAGELFKQYAGVNMTHVPYKGSAPALTDLLSGHVQVMFDAISSSLPHVQAGKLRGLALGSAERTAVLPDVPTLAESGYPKFRAVVWYAIVTPHDVAEPIARRLKAAIDKTLLDQSFRSLLEKLGYIVQRPHDEQAVAKFVDEERARWETVIRTQNISLD